MFGTRSHSRGQNHKILKILKPLKDPDLFREFSLAKGVPSIQRDPNILMAPTTLMIEWDRPYAYFQQRKFPPSLYHR